MRARALFQAYLGNFNGSGSGAADGLKTNQPGWLRSRLTFNIIREETDSSDEGSFYFDLTLFTGWFIFPLLDGVDKRSQKDGTPT